MKLKETLMHKCALSEQGAKDMIKAFVSVTVSNLVLMVPIALLYYMVKDYMEGNLAGKGFWYVAGIVVTFVLIAVTTYIQYNATFLATYIESGVRRITLARFPFSGKRICLILRVRSWRTVPRWKRHRRILFRNLSELAFRRQSLPSDYFSLTGVWQWQHFGYSRFLSSL